MGKLNQKQRAKLLSYAKQQLDARQKEYDDRVAAGLPGLEGDSEDKFGEQGYINDGNRYEVAFVEIVAPLIGEEGLKINSEKTVEGKVTELDLEEKDATKKAEYKEGPSPFMTCRKHKALKYPKGIAPEWNWTFDKADLIRYDKQGKPKDTRFFHVQCYPKAEGWGEKCYAVFGIYETTLGKLDEIAKDAPERPQNGRKDDGSGYDPDTKNKPWKYQIDLKKLHCIIRYRRFVGDEDEVLEGVIFEDEPEIILAKSCAASTS